jgi:hypothetical protein
MGDTIEALAPELQGAFRELHDALAGRIHAVLRGSHEAALFEAQGGEIYRAVRGDLKPFQHLRDLENAGAVVSGRAHRVESLLGKLGSLRHGAMVRTRESLRPMIERAKEVSDTMFMTRQHCRTLEQSVPARFHGVWFAAGERTAASLVSHQLQRRALMLRAQGAPASRIPPPHLLPPDHAGGRIIARIRALPITPLEAEQSTALIAAAARSALTQAAALATQGVGQRVLRMLAAAIERVVSGAAAL